MIENEEMVRSLVLARKCYSIAKLIGYGEEYSREMFMVGLLKGIGKEFSDSDVDDESAKLVGLLSKEPKYRIMKLISGKCDNSIETQILEFANELIGSDGTDRSVSEYLGYLASKYGTGSVEYSNAVSKARSIGLLE